MSALQEPVCFYERNSQQTDNLAWRRSFRSPHCTPLAVLISHMPSALGSWPASFVSHPSSLTEYTSWIQTTILQDEVISPEEERILSSNETSESERV